MVGSRKGKQILMLILDLLNHLTILITFGQYLEFLITIALFPLHSEKLKEEKDGFTH
jgi:hypothetical protein